MRNLDTILYGLQDAIGELVEIRWLFSRDPARDFRRHRLLDFRTLIRFLLELGAGTLRSALLQYFGYSAKSPTPGALVQQRHKLLPEALMHLFMDMNHRFPMQQTYKGYHLRAVNGTYLPITPDENDVLTYVSRSKDEKPYALLRLRLMYDVLEGRYTDCIVQPMRGKSEGNCLVEMLERWHAPKCVIVIADRAYEAWNVFAHLTKLGVCFLIRAKSPTNPGGILQGLPVPKDGTYDKQVKAALSHSRAKAIMKMPGYKFINRDTVLDYLDAEHPVYELELRVTRLKLPGGHIETLISNLPMDKFSTEDIQKLYDARWTEEESFSTLKYDEGLLAEHSKTPEFILQEIYARLVVYNFDSLIMHNLEPLEDGIRDTSQLQADPVSTNADPIQKSATDDKEQTPVSAASSSAQPKHPKRYNTAVEVLLSHLFRRSIIDAKTLQVLMTRALLPVRPDYGTHPRRKRKQTSINFRYRTVA